jgi:hypothetical protein
VQADTYIFVPFSVGRSISVTAFGVFVTSSSTGAVRYGIYSNTFSGGSDLPNSRLVQTADIDTSGTSNTFRTGAASITLDPGTLYWFAFVKRGSASIANLGSDRYVLGRTADNSNTLITALTASATSWTELPATAPTVAASTSINFRVASFFEE